MGRSEHMWSQFRRLLLGTVVEVLLQERVAIDFRSLAIDFHDDSEFRVPRLDNYMRFKGALHGTLLEPAPPGTDRRLRLAMETAWPQLLSVVDIPIGDRLTPDRNLVQVSVEKHRLVVRFDLVAD